MDKNERSKRFWNKVRASELNDCWNWTGALMDGYGIAYNGKRMELAHTFAYREIFGTSPPARLSHVCPNKKCVNPSHMKIISSTSDVTRFWSKVAQIRDGCWIWLGAKDKDGYGVCHDGRSSRKVFALGQIDLKPDQLVLHNCDNPSCVNPQHLRIGTHSENRMDAFARGRAFVPSGEDHPHAKLDASEVRKIRRLLKEGLTSAVILARVYGVSQATISLIKNQKTWKS